MKISLLLAAMLALPVYAQTPSAQVKPDNSVIVSFDKISVLALVNFVYGDILKTNFAVHPDLEAMTKTVTLHFQKDMDKSKLSAFIKELLGSVGVTVDQKPGYVYITPTTKNAEQLENLTFFYTPKFRSVSYIVDLTSNLFKVGAFSSQRAIRSAPPPLNVPGAMPIVPPVTDTGTSAFSQISKPDQDSFIFTGPPLEVAQLQSLLPQIDTPINEVLVKGALYEVTTSKTDANAFNLVLSLFGGNVGLSMGQKLTGNSATFSTPAVDAVFSLIANDTRFKSLASPYLRVKSGGSARFAVGADVPVLGAVQLDRSGNPVQSVDYRPSGVIFDIKPLIRGDVIDLQINQQLSSFVTTSTGVNNSPTLIKREISTSVGALDGDVIVLGGLDESKTTQDQNRLPVVPSWFQSKSHIDSQTQIVLILHVKKQITKSI